MTEDEGKIIFQEYVKYSGSSIYILIPKSIRDPLGVTGKSMYRLAADPKTGKVELKFINEPKKEGEENGQKEE